MMCATVRCPSEFTHLMSWSTILLFATISPHAAANQTLVVPQDHPDLQTALNAASDGDTIVVQTSAVQFGFPDGIVVDKSVTIRGEPICEIENGFGAGLLLAGDGDDVLRLENVLIAYASATLDGSPPITGQGFRTLELVQSTVEQDNFPGFVTASFPGIELLDAEQITVIDSYVEGGKAGTDGCVFESLLPQYVDGSPGIRAPQADVVLVRSTVEGGRGGLTEETPVPCPVDLDDWPGKGGAGVVAANLYAQDSTFTGGAGATWRSFTSGLCGVDPFEVCGTQPEGPQAVVSGTVQFATVLLYADQSEIPLQTGGSQGLALSAGPSNAGAVYLVLGSTSGSSPGVPIGAGSLPLVAADGYFVFTLTHPNSGLLSDSLGVLDGNGEANAAFTLQPNSSPSLFGLQVTHAYVVLDPVLQPLAASNAVELTITYPPLCDPGPDLTFPQASPLGVPTTVPYDASGSEAGASPIVSYAWEFGDGSSSTTPSGFHAYTGTGFYDQNLTVTDGLGQTSTCTRVVEINAQPLADFFPKQGSFVAVGQPTTFDASASCDPQPEGGCSTEAIVLYRWDFDGVPFDTTSPIAEHTFPSDKGDVTVSLTVIDDDGLAGSNLATEMLQTNVPPDCSLTSSDLPGNAVLLDASGSFDPDGFDIYSYCFDFGDGSSDCTGQGETEVVHVYAQPGSYTVTLTVWDDVGLSSSCTKTVQAN